MHRPRWGVALVPLTLMASMTIGSPALAAPAAGSFVSSFEADDPQPTWTDTVETDAGGDPRSSGVDGNIAVGMPGSLRDRVFAIAANAEPNSSEGVRNLNDGDSGTKWLVEDSCKGTLTRVTQGSVSVRHRGRTIIVRAGKRYLAKPR